MNMGWNRVKIVVVGVLIAFNLFLLYMIREQARQSEYIPEQTAAQIVKLLEKDGITLADGALSRKKETPVIYGGDLPEDYYTETAAALSGSMVSLSFPSPNGVVLSMENGDRCAFNGGFRMRYETDGFTELLEESGFFGADPVHFMEQESLALLTSREERVLSETVSSFLMRADGITERGAQYPVRYEVLASGFNENTRVRYLVCVQTVRGMRVMNLCSVFAVLDGKVIGMSGEWSFAAVGTAYSAQLYDQIHILYSVKEHMHAQNIPVAVRITSIALVYTVYYQADSGAYYMIPMWNVATDTGESYLFNGVDGSYYTE